MTSEEHNTEKQVKETKIRHSLVIFAILVGVMKEEQTC